VFIQYFYIVICLFTITPQLAVAQEIWDLSRIVKQANDHAFSLKASDQEVLRAQKLADQAGQWDNPEISASHGPYWEGVKGKATSAQITQSVPIFGQKSIAAKIGEQERMVVESERDFNKLLVQHEVVRLSYRLAAILEQEKHTAHRRERLSLIANYLKSRPFASPSQAVEKNLIENRMREIEEKFAVISAEREKAWQNLNIYLGLKESIVPGVKWFDHPASPNRGELGNLATQANPELVRQSRMVASAQLQVEQAGKKAYPDVRLGAGYYNQEVGLDKQRSYVGIIELSIPIWNRGGYAKDAARAQTESEKFKLEHKKREIDSEFQQGWAQLVEAKKRVEIFPRSLVETLEKQMKNAEQNWKKGLVNAPAFLELESQVHEQAAKVYDAQADYVQSLSQIELLAGRTFEVEGR
jgi:outer membrane protein TolC